MDRQRGDLSVEVLIRKLSFLQEYWKQVGSSLHIAEDTLQEIADEDSSPYGKLERVITTWVEANQCRLLLPPLRDVLLDADFTQQDNNIFQLIKNVMNNKDEMQEGEEEEELEEEEETEGDEEDSDSDEGEGEGADEPKRTTFRRMCNCLGKLKCLFTRKKFCLLINFAVIVAAVFMAKSIAKYPDDMDDLERLLAENEDSARQLLDIGVREVRILVTGKTGTGKSALINGIMGTNVSEEGDSLDPTTMQVERYERKVRGIPMIVFDSPGLQDGTENEKEYLLDMERQCKEVDLVLYTMRMSDKRLHTDDTEAMRKLTHAFGEKFWENAMFVMTFANEVRDPEAPDDEAQNMIHFAKKLTQWKKKIPDTLEKELNISKEVAERIHIVPAGYYKQPHLPGLRYWFSEFWRTALDHMKECSKDGYSLILEFQKDRFKRVYELTAEDLNQELQDQPIVVPPPSQSSSSKTQIIDSVSIFIVFIASLTMHYC